MPDFINTEHCVEKLFPVGTTFSFEGKKYQVALCGKPRLQSPNQKIPDRKTKCVIKTHINIKQNVIFGAKLKPV